MKLSIATIITLFSTSASAFAPTSSNKPSSKTAIFSTVPPANDWKGYYTNYDDAQVVKTGADVGFDPLGFSETNAGLFFMREAEIKHCRLAMVSTNACS